MIRGIEVSRNLWAMTYSQHLAKEIMARVLEKTPNNMDFGLSSSEVYVVSKNNSVIQKMDIEIKKSTIQELDQTFVDEILREMPKNEESTSSLIVDYGQITIAHKGI